MPKTLLITGSTDGIGLATAKLLAAQGHTVLLHGRDEARLAGATKTVSGMPGAGRVETYLADLSRLADAAKTVSGMPDAGRVETYLADLSRLAEVQALAQAVAERHDRLDVLINNAGVFRTPVTVAPGGLDMRFVVNVLAPALLTRGLLSRMDSSGRVINLSSAAQAPVDLEALAGRRPLNHMPAYAQSKLALTMWSRHLAQSLGADGPVVVAVNPGSMLGSKMVKEGFGVAGGDIGIGAGVLVRAALSDEFAHASGRYFDNDAGRFAEPHPDALDPRKTAQVVRAIEALLRDRA